jgi:hypothetical protein
MRKTIIAGLLTGAALLGAAPAQADVDLNTMTAWACQRLDAQPTLGGVSNVLAILGTRTHMSTREVLVVYVAARCPRNRAVIEDYFGIGYVPTYEDSLP